MTFDFFETSYLAFGSKLTAAFTTLDNLAMEAEENLKQVFENQSIMEQYVNKNYRVPRPTEADNPCRSNEFYDMVNDKKVYIKSMTATSNNFTVDLILFNSATNKVSKLSGSTGYRSGYCFYKESISNTSPNGTLEFSQSANGSGTLLFQFRIDSSNIINIVGSPTALNLRPYGIHQYSSMSRGLTLANDSNSYTASDYMCVCVVGKQNDLVVKVNGTTIMKGQGNACKRHCIVYLKKGDKISGTYDTIFKVNYGQR